MSKISAETVAEILADPLACMILKALVEAGDKGFARGFEAARDAAAKVAEDEEQTLVRLMEKYPRAAGEFESQSLLARHIAQAIRALVPGDHSRLTEQRESTEREE